MSVFDNFVRKRFQNAHIASRGSWLAVAAGAATIVAIARVLVPDVHGFGTHTQLGLPQCGFMALTGLPCPACGLTTCFAHMARAEFADAVHANPIGVLLFGGVVAIIPSSVWASARNCAFFETCARMRIAQACIVATCALFAQWLLRVGCLLLG